MENLQKLKKYVQENGGWVCNSENLYFKTNEEIKSLMCHFIKTFYKFSKKKKKTFSPFKLNYLIFL